MGGKYCEIKGSDENNQSKTISLVIALANKIMNELNFAETINKQVKWDKEQWHETPGDLAKVLVLTAFTDMRVPLTHIQERTQGMDLDFLLGKNNPSRRIDEFSIV